MNKPFIYLIKFYRFCISPLFASSCRFHPSCSSYALQAFQEYGLLKALQLTLYRLFRCHPFCDGGVDPLPLNESKIEPRNEHG
ncbi:MAG: membrane protein insertion efficiency factor YidD [Cycloclasticus sp. symbiont of Poecilosclerida sp. M]|nr:MAG: membrane protein insertion efficiency factor YidD [Cycloclasticus sp. symbiont of Poecilosclerida sp. M]